MDTGETAAPGQAKDAALRGVRFGAVQSLGTQILTAGTTAILTRLLAPEDFGLIAVATAVSVLFTSAVELGIGASLVQRSEVDQTTKSSFLWLALALGAGAAVTLVAFSPPFAGLFGARDAAPLVAAMGPVVLLGLVRSVPQSLLYRQLRFGKVAAIGLSGIGTYVVVAVALAAFTDLGAWSVILGRVVAAVIRTVLAFGLARWLPSFVFAWSVIRSDITFNLGFMASRLAAWVTKNVDYVVVGRLFGQEVLGIYYVAYVLPNLVRQRMTTVANRTLFPVLSRIRDDRERLARAYLQALTFVALVVLPAMLGLAAVADVAVPLIFGADWEAAANPMAILSIGAGLSALVPAVQSVLAADGVPWRTTAVPLSRLVALGIGLAAVAGRGGIEAVAWAVTGSAVVAVIVAQWLVARRLNISLTTIFSSLLPGAIPAAGMLGVVVGIKSATDGLGRGWLHLALLIAVGVTAYLGLGFALYRKPFGRVMRDVRAIVAPSRKPSPAEPESDAGRLIS